MCYGRKVKSNYKVNMMTMENSILSKITSCILVLGLMLSSFPSLTSAQTSEQQGYIPLESVVSIPVVTVNGERVYRDISRIDWSRQVTINGRKVALNSEEALSAISIPFELKQVIRSFRDDKAGLERSLLIWPWVKAERKAQLDEALKYSLSEKLINRGELPENYHELSTLGRIEEGANILSAANAFSLDPSKIVGVEEKAEILDVSVVEDHAGKSNLIEDVGNLIRKTIDQVVSLLKPNKAYADIATVNSNAINYLIAQQNPDGSWGTATSTRFITTVAVLDALLSNNVTGTTTNDGVAWLSDYAIDNNDYFAEQVTLLARAGAGTSTVETLAQTIDEDTGGFPYTRGYQADPITTAKAIQALHFADFRDPGPQPYVTASLALHHLINTQRFDDGWSISGLGGSPIPATTEVIEALLLWKNQSLGSTQINDTLNPAVSALINLQLSNGTWGDDLLNTALAYHAIKSAGQIPTYQLDTVEYLEDEQLVNGSFDNDLYKTAKVAKALSIATNSGQLLVTDIIPTSTIQTGTTTTFKIRMTNPGNVAVDTGKLHMIADDYHVNTWDFQTNGIVVNASSTVDVTVGISSTRNYLGNVKFKFFVEGTNGVVHPGSRYEETLTYATAADNRPALPMYFVAHKSVSSGGAAAITWRWPIKTDPKLKNVVLLWRVQGTTTWSAANVTSTTTTSVATVGGLTNNTVYEATIGTTDTANNLNYFTGSSISLVKVSNSASTYISGSATGSVKSINGVVPNVQVVGVTASTTAQSNESGVYTQQNAPWGTNYVRVNDFRYEAYTRKYTTADTNVTGVDVYTNSKPDTANPTVSGVSIVGEGDYVMENNETELIQYTVGDDIGSGGGIVQSASLYYYDPDSSSWHLIGTESGFLTGTRTYAWNIPDDLVGTGFKIKVIARDFAGKDSVATEWPSGTTFELVSGNASPSFVFTAPVSGAPANADTSFIIKWTDSDPDSNATTTLSYDSDTNAGNGNHTLITILMEDDPVNQYVWDTSGIATSTKYIRADLADGHNGTTTVYSTAPVNISH